MFYSGKNKLRGLQTEVSELPVGLAVPSLNHYPDSISDLKMLHRRTEKHRSLFIEAET